MGSNWRFGWIKFLGAFGAVALLLLVLAAIVIAIPLTLGTLPFVIAYVVTRAFVSGLSHPAASRTLLQDMYAAKLRGDTKNFNDLLELAKQARPKYEARLKPLVPPPPYNPRHH